MDKVVILWLDEGPFLSFPQTWRCTMYTLKEAQDRVTERWPELWNKARAHFHEYSPDAREEAADNAMYLTWHNLASMIEQDRCDDAMITTTFNYSLRATRSGRVMKAVHGSKFREIFSHHTCIHAGLAINAFISAKDDVPDIVSFRIDTPAWLDSLPETQRQRAIDMSDGSDTKELAQRWGVSPGAVSQTRQTLAKSYAKFMHASE